MYDPKTQRLHVSRDVVFEEEKQWEWEASGTESTSRTGEVFIVQYPDQ
jgi:hypothetical protein